MTTDRTVTDIIITPEQREAIKERLDSLEQQREWALNRVRVATEEARALEQRIKSESEAAARVGIGPACIVDGLAVVASASASVSPTRDSAPAVDVRAVAAQVLQRAHRESDAAKASSLYAEAREWRRLVDEPAQVVEAPNPDAHAGLVEGVGRDDQIQLQSGESQFEFLFRVARERGYLGSAAEHCSKRKVAFLLRILDDGAVAQGRIPHPHLLSAEEWEMNQRHLKPLLERDIRHLRRRIEHIHVQAEKLRSLTNRAMVGTIVAESVEELLSFIALEDAKG